MTYLFNYSQMLLKIAMAYVPILDIYASGTVRCSFLVGRSRRSPVRPISVPRLDLQAAILSMFSLTAF